MPGTLGNQGNAPEPSLQHKESALEAHLSTVLASLEQIKKDLRDIPDTSQPGPFSSRSVAPKETATNRDSRLTRAPLFEAVTDDSTFRLAGGIGDPRTSRLWAFNFPMEGKYNRRSEGKSQLPSASESPWDVPSSSGLRNHSTSQLQATLEETLGAPPAGSTAKVCEKKSRISSAWQAEGLSEIAPFNPIASDGEGAAQAYESSEVELSEKRVTLHAPSNADQATDPVHTAECRQVQESEAPNTEAPTDSTTQGERVGSVMEGAALWDGDNRGETARLGLGAGNTEGVLRGIRRAGNKPTPSDVPNAAKAQPGAPLSPADVAFAELRQRLKSRESQLVPDQDGIPAPTAVSSSASRPAAFGTTFPPPHEATGAFFTLTYGCPPFQHYPMPLHTFMCSF